MSEPTSSNYPTSLDTDVSLGGDQVNFTSLNLDASLDGVTTTVSVAEDISSVNVPCYLLVGTELIYATAKNSGNFTSCTRGAGGTSAASHSNGDDVFVVYAANLFNQLKRAIVAIETELGLDPAGTKTDLVSRLIQSLSTAGNLDFATSTELTIATGAAVPTQNWHTIDTEGDAASDDLDTLTATNATDGFVLFLRANNASRTVVIKHNTGNIVSVSASDITLDETYKMAILIYDATLVKWIALYGPDISATSTTTLTNKRITPRITTEASSATPTINTDNADIHTITALAAAITSFTTNLSGTPTNGQKLMIEVLDNGTARAITWGASFASGPATLPTTTVVNKWLYVGLEWSSSRSKWICLAAGSEA